MCATLCCRPPEEVARRSGGERIWEPEDRCLQTEEEWEYSLVRLLRLLLCCACCAGRGRFRRGYM